MAVYHCIFLSSVWFLLFKSSCVLQSSVSSQQQQMILIFTVFVLVSIRNYVIVQIVLCAESVRFVTKARPYDSLKGKCFFPFRLKNNLIKKRTHNSVMQVSTFPPPIHSSIYFLQVMGAAVQATMARFPSARP